MRSAILILVAFSLLTVAGGAVAPGVCVNLQGGASALVSFVSDPEPDLLLAPGSLLDAALTCPP